MLLSTHATKRWSFFTNHGLLLGYIYTNPRSTTREIANTLGITERTAHKIIADLVIAGYVIRRKQGRRNSYRVNPRLPLRVPSNPDLVVGDLLKVITPVVPAPLTHRDRELALMGARLAARLP